MTAALLSVNSCAGLDFPPIGPTLLGCSVNATNLLLLYSLLEIPSVACIDAKAAAVLFCSR